MKIARELVPLRIHSGAEPAEDPFVQVRYLDQWFWIDGDDEQSKESFGLLTYLYLMMAPQPEERVRSDGAHRVAAAAGLALRRGRAILAA